MTLHETDAWTKGLVLLGALFFIYAVLGNYVALPGFVRFLERGEVSRAGNSFDVAVLIGMIKMIAWMLSFQLGLLCLAFAALRRGGVRPKLMYWGIVATVCWLAFTALPLPRPLAAFYIVFGSAILCLIGSMTWRWASLRSTVPDELKRKHDQRLVGYLFFGFATWDVCGLGSVGMMLDPERVIELGVQEILASQSTKIMIEFAIGWLFTWFSVAPITQTQVENTDTDMECVQAR